MTTRGWGPGVVLALLVSAPVSALTLEESIALALARNERAKMADESVAAADARVAKARAFFFPDLVVTGDYVRRSHETTRTVDGETSVLQTQDGLEGRVTLHQTIIDAQGFPLLSAARHSRDAAQLDALDEKRRLAYETADAFLAVLAREQVARAAGQRVDLAQRNLDEIRVRQGAGLVGSNDATRAELELASAERERVDLDGGLRIARLNLGYLLDAPIADSLAVPAALLERASQPAEALAAEPAPEGPNAMTFSPSAPALRHWSPSRGNLSCAMSPISTSWERRGARTRAASASAMKTGLWGSGSPGKSSTGASATRIAASASPTLAPRRSESRSSSGA